ncbi:integrase core domain-containing protein [Aeromonas veronii]|uniref:integrase core domain-containing protein n=1 Tax=Aeromonas TaxID=642 RepID=UPI0038D2C9E6
MQRFEALQRARQVIGDWIQFYNQKFQHQALKMKTPAHACVQAAHAQLCRNRGVITNQRYILIN